MSEATSDDVQAVAFSDMSDAEAGYVHTVPPDPRRLESIENPRVEEDGCTAITEQKKYYWFEDPKQSVVIKRSLTPSEYIYSLRGDLLVPYKCLERMKNEVAAISYVQRHTSIPTPNIRCAFEDHRRYYIITDIVPGVTLAELPDDKKAMVFKELEGYIAQMQALKSKTMGSVTGEMILPYRLSRCFPSEAQKVREADTPEFVFCHNDLSQHNVMVDETTLKINAILDWEYAGFFPPKFDGAFYLRPGPSCALADEVDDVNELWEVFQQWVVWDES